VERYSEEFVFLGDLYDHFGHFLIEGLNRLWFLDLIPPERRRKIRFLMFRSWSDPDRSMLWKILDLYGVAREQVLVADKPMLFTKLTVPSPAQRPFIGWELYNSQTMELFYRDLADRILRAWPNSVPTGDRIYFSRERFVASGGGRRALIESPAVENLYRSRGFAIVHPETLPFADQVRLARHCKEIAGPSGSAHHIAAFAAGLERQTVLTPPDFFLPPVDVSFTMYKGARLFYYFGRPREQAAAGTLDANWHVDLRAFTQFFDMHHPPTSARDRARA
jgi:capsular polysaccharide biosynthesis protein